MSFVSRFWWPLVFALTAQAEEVPFNPFNDTLLDNATSTTVVPGSRAMGLASTTPMSSSMANGSSIDPMLACDDEWKSWRASSMEAVTVTSTTEYTKLIIETHTVYQSTWTCSSTCGDICYADATTTSSSVYETTSTSTSTDYFLRPWNIPTPNCSVPLSACSSLHSVYTSSAREYVKWEAGTSFETPPEYPRVTPACQICNKCYLLAEGKLQLFYWPVPETVTRDMCATVPTAGYLKPVLTGSRVRTSHAEITTGPSAVLSGYTFYSGNVYLSIPAASASDDCTSVREGKVLSNIMLTLASSDVWSVRDDYGSYSIDYADFNTPYPWSAYKGALQACHTGWNRPPGPACTQSTVFNDQFHPLLGVPAALEDYIPEWKGCRPIHIMVDPPVALQTATMFTSMQSAAPVSTDVPAVPERTELPPQTGALPPEQTIRPSSQDPESLKGGGDPKQTGGQIDSGADVEDPQKSGAQGGNPNNDSQPTKTADRPNAPNQPIITIGPSTFPIVPRPNGGGSRVVINPGTTIQNCGPAATIGETVVSVCNSGVTVSDARGTRTVPILKDNVEANEGQGGGVINIGGENFIVDPRGDLVKPGKFLEMDDPAATIGGMEASVGASGVVIVDPATGETKTVSFQEDIRTITAANNVMSIAADGGLVVGPGTTLRAGEDVVTVDGTVVNVGMDGGVTVVGPSGTTTVVDSKGITTISDEKGTTTATVSNGTSTTTDSTRATTTVEESGSQTTNDGDRHTLSLILWLSVCILFLGLA